MMNTKSTGGSEETEPGQEPQAKPSPTALASGRWDSAVYERNAAVLNAACDRAAYPPAGHRMSSVAPLRDYHREAEFLHYLALKFAGLTSPDLFAEAVAEARDMADPVARKKRLGFAIAAGQELSQSVEKKVPSDTPAVPLPDTEEPPL